MREIRHHLSSSAHARDLWMHQRGRGQGQQGTANPSPRLVLHRYWEGKGDRGFNGLTTKIHY